MRRLIFAGSPLVVSRRAATRPLDIEFDPAAEDSILDATGYHHRAFSSSSAAV